MINLEFIFGKVSYGQSLDVWNGGRSLRPTVLFIALTIFLNIPSTMTYLTEKEGTLGMNEIATISKERAEEYFVSFKSKCMA